jgi:hypothetical protein
MRFRGNVMDVTADAGGTLVAFGLDAFLPGCWADGEDERKISLWFCGLAAESVGLGSRAGIRQSREMRL